MQYIGFCHRGQQVETIGHMIVIHAAQATTQVRVPAPLVYDAECDRLTSGDERWPRPSGTSALGPRCRQGTVSLPTESSPAVA